MSSCEFCSQVEPRMMNTPHWVGDRESGHWVRIDVCTRQECRDMVADRPRAARKPKQPRQVPATDYNMLAAYLGAGKRKMR